MGRQGHVVTGVDNRYSAATEATSPEVHQSMQYLPLFLLMMAVLIAAYFYLDRAKKRGTVSDATKNVESTSAPAPQTSPDRPE
jgi:cytochrome bd-type quinol oxidase subunit 1